MAAVDASIYEKFTVESADGSRTVDIRQGVVGFVYYENILAPSITATVVVVNTGGTIRGENGKMQGIYNGLPLRGGERVIIKIAGNSKSNDGLDFSKNVTQYFYVASIQNVDVSAEKELFTLHLVSRESITNQTIRVGRKFPTSQTISDSVSDIIKDYLKSDKFGTIDQTQNKYGFIGNLKKPFSVITWLASKSVAYNGPGKDSTAGFLFYETQEGFNFRSIDNLINQDPFIEDYTYSPGVVKFDDPSKDFKIIKYSIDRNQDLMGKLQRGAYSSERYYINPVSFKPDIRHFKSTDYMGDDGINNLGDEKITLPSIDDDKSLGDLPTRIFVGMLDVGTVEKTTTDKGWNDPAERNADPAKTQAQSMMRYNQLMSQIVEITVPLNTNLTAGGVMRCIFPSIDRSKRKSPDVQSSGLYMIRELAHYFDGKGSYTKLKIVRDSSGRK